MPRMDGTGPLGQGSMTGRGMGKCGGNKRNFGGRGLGIGRSTGSPKNNLQTLEEEEKFFNDKLELIKKDKEALKKQK
jgi:hypothetical protein